MENQNTESQHDENAKIEEGPRVGEDVRQEMSDSLENIDGPPLRDVKSSCISTRYTVTFMIFMGFMIMFGMRCNLSGAKLSWEDNEKKRGIVFMNWTRSTENNVDSTFFWGYLIAIIPGAIIAFKYAAFKFFGYSVVGSCFLNLLVPFCMTLTGNKLIILVRFWQGLFEGVSFPAFIGTLCHWTPPMERSRRVTLAISGQYAGLLIGMPLSKIMSDQSGYEKPFYVYGLIGILWYCFWRLKVVEIPRSHPKISKAEVNYIENSLEESVPSPRTLIEIPWRNIWNSKPVYAIIVANFCHSWTFYMLVLFQTAFLRYKFGFQMHETGLVGVLPFLIMLITVFLGGQVADLLRKRGTLSTTNGRKVFNSVGLGVQGLVFLYLAHCSTAGAAIIAMLLGSAFSGFAMSGYPVNCLDIAPRYASLLMGISKGIATFAGVLVPLVIDPMIKKYPYHCWTTFFTLAAVMHFIGCIFYGIFASGELQPWAKPKPENNRWSPLVNANAINNPNEQTHA